MLELGPLAFASPAILLALLLLPALWWLLRITPPMPRLVKFPAIRLLFGLRSREETPASAPLWLILLRLAMAALLILGLAGPLLNPGGVAGGGGPLLLVVDDGWAAASGWDRRMQTLSALIDQAARAERPVLLLTTATDEAGRPPAPTGLLTASEARAIAGALRPKPWPVDREAASAALAGVAIVPGESGVWLSDGVQGPGAESLIEQLRRRAALRVLADPPADLPVLLLPPEPGAIDFTATVRRTDGAGARTWPLSVIAVDGRVLAAGTASFADGETIARTGFDLPLELRNDAARIEIGTGGTAAGVALLDERWRRRPIGLLSTSPMDSDLSLLDELYYIDRALSPFGEVRRDGLDALIAGDKAAIAVPDGQKLVSTEIAALDRWIREGGLLLRFAGPRLAESGGDGLVPVTLRGGGRTLGGAMVWTEPAQLAPFAEDSPYFGLTIPADVRVTRQVLAEPSLDLPGKTWARLQDGTPLVTAERRDKGWLVLIHTTANPDWSNLALSGLFVEMLERTVAMSRGVAGEAAGSRPLPPLEMLDAFGHSKPPPAAAKPIDSAEFDAARPGPATPPGYYGSTVSRRALNLAPSLGPVAPLALPEGLVAQPYAIAPERDLMPWLLAAALLLLLADTVAALLIRGLAGRVLRQAASGTAFAIALALAGQPGEAWAQNGPDAFALEATSAMRLAYVKTGIESVDATSHAGLHGLSVVLNRRTAVETGEPMGVDPVRDDLAFFPLLYWPVTDNQSPLAPDTAARLNRYLENGGTILFDTRDGGLAGAGPGAGAQRLRDLARGLDIPRLVPVPVDHVLTKSFYLMQEFPGRWTGGALWVELAGERVNDGVSRIVVGGNDWAAAWAMDENGLSLFPVVPGGEAQREMAYRFGVNLVMYTLTGNYKADQVHIPAILERLGQ